MKVVFTGMIAAAALQVAVVFSVAGQEALPARTYTGPRFPGGPDSLRALLQRSTRAVASPPAGRAIVQLELQEGRQPLGYKLIGTTQKGKGALTKAAEASLRYLEAHMPAWEPGVPDPDAAAGKNPRFLMALDYATPPTAQPYPYADQEPGFPDFAALLRAQRSAYFERALANPTVLANLASTAKGLTTYVQMQVKYPPAALRQRAQGVVQVYFEVAPTGAIEEAQIISSAGNALDEEVLRAIRQLPAATSPALLRGQPVRVFYVVPFTFKIQ